ncbi:hypothetical protein RDI58_022494 [Solanum bulbocastanum]|uniref:Uncharacterized protein n=1 Tax=Solanum bulbocastanum TaxID=147425 RepID=A0AAN8Y5A0_SOLBU
MFLNSFSIEKKPDICDLIEATILVGASKYPVEFEKHKNRIFNMIKYPGEHDIDDEDDDISTFDDNDDETIVEVPEKEEEEGLGTQQITTESNKPLHLDRGKQLQKQSHKGFKKMESDTEKKREEGAQQTPIQCRRKECTAGLTKSMLPLFMNMNVEVSPPQPKQSNCSSSTRLMQKTLQSSAVARPMQKETQSDSDMKKKFESSKKKFEQRLANQRKAKIRIIKIRLSSNA